MQFDDLALSKLREGRGIVDLRKESKKGTKTLMQQDEKRQKRDVTMKRLG